MNKEHKHTRIISKMSPERIMKRLRERAQNSPIKDIMKKLFGKVEEETELSTENLEFQ